MMNFIVQGSSRSWAGDKEHCMYLLDGYPAIYWTIKRIYDNFSNVKLLLIAPEYDKGGDLESLRNLFKDLEIFYSFNESPLKRMIEVTSFLDKDENFILTKTLDSLYKNEKIDLIKMDIEGFEMNALLGARNIIKNQTPTLILSAYHKNKDIYDFIDFIESLSTEYKLFCYHHPLTYHEIEYYFINKKLYKD